MNAESAADTEATRQEEESPSVLAAASTESTELGLSLGVGFGFLFLAALFFVYGRARGNEGSEDSVISASTFL